MKSYIDKTVPAIEKISIEESMKKAIDPVEAKKIQDLLKETKALYYSVEEPLGLFQFDNYAENGDNVIFKRMTDQNFIPLASGNKKTQNVGFVELGSKFVQLVESEVLHQISEMKNKKLTILYQQFGDKEFSIVGLTPECNMGDYDINFDYEHSKVGSVRNKQFGDVVWTSELVDNEYAFLSITPIEIYSQELESDVYNLLHVHIAAIGESATLDLTYVPDNEDLKNYYKLEKDATGVDLKYRILVQKNNVRAILYNFKGKTRELKYVETKFAVEDIVNITNLHIENAQYARIIAIPIQTLCTTEKSKLDKYELGEPLCKKMSNCKVRFFAELQGYVDLEIIPNLSEKPNNLTRISAPLCQIFKDPDGKKRVEEIMLKWEMSNVKKLVKMLDSLKSLISLYKEKSANMAKSEKQDLLSKLQQSEAELMAVPEDENNKKEGFIVFFQ